MWANKEETTWQEGSILTTLKISGVRLIRRDIKEREDGFDRHDQILILMTTSIPTTVSGTMGARNSTMIVPFPWTRPFGSNSCQWRRLPSLRPTFRHSITSPSP